MPDLCQSDSLQQVTPDQFFDIYAPNGSVPLQQNLGLRFDYYWGLYGHCGYMNETDGLCANQTFGKRYEPFTVVLEDITLNRQALTDRWFVRTTAFTDSKYTGQSTKAAYWMILLGTICAGLAFITYALPSPQWSLCPC
jgi:hypothetical protein